MERGQFIAVFAILGVLLINLALWRHVTVTTESVRTDLQRGLATQTAALDAMRRDYDSRINEHTVRINDVEGELNARTEILKQELGGSVKQIASSLATVKQQSEQKLSQLENQLLSMDVRSADFSDVISEVIKSVVSIRTAAGGGSGAVVDSRGYIVTNYHVVAGASEVQVVTYKRGTYPGSVIGYDPVHDIAVVKIVAETPAMKFGDSDNMDVGHKVVALGSPGGLDFTATEGIISARRRDSRNVEYFQMDVPVNPGNSGGPIISSRGRIIGIAQSKVLALEGVGFAITANDIDDIVEGIIARDAGE